MELTNSQQARLVAYSTARQFTTDHDEAVKIARWILGDDDPKIIVRNALESAGLDPKDPLCKIKCIKEIRAALNVGLKEALDFYESTY